MYINFICKAVRFYSTAHNFPLHKEFVMSQFTTDEALVERYRAGDASAFDTLYARHHDSVVSAARRAGKRLPADFVDDAAQAAWLKAVEYEPGSLSFQAWITDQARKEMRTIALSHHLCVQLEGSRERQGVNYSETLNARIDVLTLLAGLPADACRYLKQKFLLGLSFSEIEQVNNLAPKEGKKRVTGALDAARQRVGH